MHKDDEGGERRIEREGEERRGREKRTEREVSGREREREREGDTLSERGIKNTSQGHPVSTRTLSRSRGKNRSFCGLSSLAQMVSQSCALYLSLHRNSVSPCSSCPLASNREMSCSHS